MPNKLHVPKMAIFVAITLAFQSIPLPPLGGGILRFAALPIILSGLLLGPKAGFWVGAVSDVLECLLIPRGRMYFPGFTITQGLTGAIPALILRNATPSYWRYLGAIALGQGLTKFILVPAFLLMIAPVHPLWTAYKVLLAQAAIAQTIHVPLYAWICLVVMRHLAPLLPNSPRSPELPQADKPCITNNVVHEATTPAMTSYAKAPVSPSQLSERSREAEPSRSDVPSEAHSIS